MIGFGRGDATPDKELERNELVAQVTPEDLERYGMIPELIGRLPDHRHAQPALRWTTSPGS